MAKCAEYGVPEAVGAYLCKLAQQRANMVDADGFLTDEGYRVSKANAEAMYQRQRQLAQQGKDLPMSEFYNNGSIKNFLSGKGSTTFLPTIGVTANEQHESDSVTNNNAGYDYQKFDSTIREATPVNDKTISDLNQGSNTYDVNGNTVGAFSAANSYTNLAQPNLPKANMNSGETRYNTSFNTGAKGTHQGVNQDMRGNYSGNDVNKYNAAIAYQNQVKNMQQGAAEQMYNFNQNPSDPRFLAMTGAGNGPNNM